MRPDQRFHCVKCRSQVSLQRVKDGLCVYCRRGVERPKAERTYDMAAEKIEAILNARDADDWGLTMPWERKRR